MGRRTVDVLDHWRDHGTIDEADYRMGQRIRDVFDASEMRGLAVLRLDRPTPGACFQNAGHQQRVAECRESLQRMRWYLGEVDDALVLDVVARGKPLDEVGRSWTWVGGQQHVARRVRLALRWLHAKRWGAADEAIEVPAVARR